MGGVGRERWEGWEGGMGEHGLPGTLTSSLSFSRHTKRMSLPLFPPQTLLPSLSVSPSTRSRINALIQSPLCSISLSALRGGLRGEKMKIDREGDIDQQKRDCCHTIIPHRRRISNPSFFFFSQLKGLMRRHQEWREKYIPAFTA